LLCQKIHIAIVIIKYSDVQTGANIQSGGLNAGLFSNEYQGSLKLIVAIPPIKEAENVIKLKSKNDMNLFFNIFPLYNKLWKKKKLFG
jgi:hypothetical protein